MPNIASVLKEEIARLARKEIRIQLKDLKEATKNQRKEISTLKKQIASLEREVIRVERAGPVPTKKPAEKAAKSKVGLTAKGLKSHRKRMGISAGDYAKLAGVSAATVYNFESGKSNPRQSVLAKLDAVRSMGKREVSALLKSEKPAKAKTAKAKPAKKSAAKTRAKSKSGTTSTSKKSPRKKAAPKKRSTAPKAEAAAEEAK